MISSSLTQHTNTSGLRFNSWFPDVSQPVSWPSWPSCLSCLILSSGVFISLKDAVSFVLYFLFLTVIMLSFASWSALPASVLFLVFSYSRGVMVNAAPTASSQVPVATPVPLVIPPSQSWDGNDGPWSSFFIRVGTPAQSLRVLISTASNQPLVVLPEGCSSTDPSDCASNRGGIFNPNASSTWYI